MCLCIDVVLEIEGADRMHTGSRPAIILYSLQIGFGDRRSLTGCQTALITRSLSEYFLES